MYNTNDGVFMIEITLSRSFFVPSSKRLLLSSRVESFVSVKI